MKLIFDIYDNNMNEINKFYILNRQKFISSSLFKSYNNDVSLYFTSDGVFLYLQIYEFILGNQIINFPLNYESIDINLDEILNNYDYTKWYFNDNKTQITIKSILYDQNFIKQNTEVLKKNLSLTDSIIDLILEFTYFTIL